jgi:hypothetical protein
MRKVVIHSAGGHDKLNVEDHPDPSPKAGEVLVAVEAAGVNFADTTVRMGLYESAKEFVGWPITPGFEVAGKVLAVGDGVSRFTPGDHVLAVTLFGGYASRVVVPEHQVFAIPDGLDTATAAGLPAVFLTANSCGLPHESESKIPRLLRKQRAERTVGPAQPSRGITFSSSCASSAPETSSSCTRRREGSAALCFNSPNTRGSAPWASSGRRARSKPRSGWAPTT